MQRLAVIRGLFGLIGLGAAIAGALYAQRETSAWPLAVFVGLITMYAIGRGVADTVTDPNKANRAAFFAIPVVAAVGILALTYWIWGTWWLAVVLGFVAGGIGSLIATAVFPRIAEEEYEDSLERSGVSREHRWTGPGWPINQ